MNNPTHSQCGKYSASLHKDPYHAQYLACLQNFDTDEIPNGYTIAQLDDMINFLVETKSKLATKNTEVHTRSLYTGVPE